MWKKLIVSGTCLLLLLLAASSFAQCPGGRCPINRPPTDIGNLPSIGQTNPHGQYGPVKQEGHLLAVVRIIGTESPGSTVRGSGTYVNYEGLYCIVTASHVVRSVQNLYVVFRNGGESLTVRGEVLANDTTNDVAIIGLYQHPADGEDIAVSVAYAGDIKDILHTTLRNYGYGGDDVLCGGAGQIVGDFGPAVGLPKSWYEVSSYARLGDSGGPVFLPSNKLVGVLWGRDDHMVAIVKPGFVHAQLRVALSKVGVNEAQLVQPRPLPRKPKALVPVLPIKPPVLPWRDKIENEIDGIKRKPPSPPVVVPAPPSVDVDVDVNTNQPKPPVVEDERYRVDRHIALPIILGAALLCVVIGVAVQWKKTYTIK